MYVFVDDSGDPGFQFQRGSTRLLVIGCLIFDDAESIRAVSAEIQVLAKRLQRQNLEEFKFSKMRYGLTSELLEAVCRYGFRGIAVIVDKQKWIESLPNDAPPLYPFALANALSRITDSGQPISLKIDGKGNRRIKLNDFDLPLPRIKKLRYVDSRSDILIQLADVVAGCVRRAHDSTDSSVRLYRGLFERVLASRVQAFWLESPVK